MHPGMVIVAIFILMMLFIALFGTKRKKSGTAAGASRSANDIYREAAEIMGVRFIKGGMFSAPRILGDIEGMTITAGIKSLANGENSIAVFEMGVRYEFACEGMLEMVSTGTPLSIRTGVMEENSLASGDEAFDSAMSVFYTMTPRCAIAILDSRLRNAVLELNKKSWALCVTKYGIHIYNREGFGDASVIVQGLRDIIAVAEILLGNSDFRRMHIENVRRDPVPAVRRTNLRMLLAHYPMDGEISSLVDECLNDPDVMIQFEAAKYLKPRGFEHIIRLIKEKKISGAQNIMEAVEAMGNAGYQEGAPFLMELYPSAKTSVFRETIFAACKKIGAADLSPFLVSLLKGKGDDVRDLAIEALETCGTVDAVEKLMKLADGTLSPFLKSRVEETIAAIQARLGDVEKGWLSSAALSEKEGALSKADGPEEGALSRAESPEERPDGIGNVNSSVKGAG